VSGGIIKKTLFGGSAYCLLATFFAPEIINPYYTTYMTQQRFPEMKNTWDVACKVRQEMRENCQKQWNKAWKALSTTSAPEPPKDSPVLEVDLKEKK
jgi:hypothetical protein